MKYLYAIILSHSTNEIIEIHDSPQAAKVARLNFAKRSIPDYERVWSHYLNEWNRYHDLEYPDHPAPSQAIILQQFLSETCMIFIQEFTLGQPAQSDTKYFLNIPELSDYMMIN